MGNLKDEAISKETEDVQEHKLTDSEMNYLRLLNVALQFHTMGQKILSGFLYYIATNRLGYKDGVNLQFELDFDKEEGLLLIKLLPDTPIVATH
jgi:hypothetical protein